MANEIIIYKGDSRTLKLTVEDSAGVAQSITGSTIKFTVKHYDYDPDSEAVIQKTTADETQIKITDGDNGEAEIYLTPSDTKTQTSKKYYYDVELTTVASKVYTVIKSDFTVVEDVTKG